MTDKRRHSIAEGFTPHSNHIKEKDKKKWSFESFSPLHFSFSRHSKSKKKSHKSHEDLTKHVDDHALETKTLSRSRWKRRASVAVVQGENLLADHAHNFEKHSNVHDDENVSIGSDSWKRRATVAALGLDNFLRDKHSSRSQQHHPSVLKLWKRKPSVHGSQQDCHLATDEDFSLVNSPPKPQLSKRRASVAVPHLHVKNHDLKVTFKTHKHRSKKSKEYFLAMVYLKDSSKRWISGEDGGGIVDLLNQATMDQRINSYRLIMASTRAILDADSCCGSPCVDPSLEDVFDELGFQMDVDGLHDPDSRFDVVNDLQKTEREYCHLVRSILDTYAEPLRKFSSLTADDHKVLFVGLEPIISISAMLTSKLEDVLKTWDSSTSQIGSLFTSKVWNLYEDYLKNYSKARKLLEDRCTADQSFLEFCNLRKEQTKNSLEKLLHLPVQRIPEYDKYLNDLLEETDSSHPDYEELSRATSRVKNMIKEHEDELGTSENKTKMDSIQLRFPNDNLQLDDGKEQKRTSSTRRRKSAPGAVLFKTLGKSKSSSNLWSSVTMGKKEMDLASPISRNQTQDNRQFVMEGQVEFATGVQIQDRYMFLFNDLLLVAKQKTSTTFKLKHRVRVCEIWISECVTDVTELTRSTELSFVMGWPLCNFVATFKTLDLKQQWLAKLTEQIENERQKEQPKVIKLKVVSREISEPCTVEVDPNMDALTVLRKCMDQTHLSDSDIKDYQMWARYGKEDSPYPLIGHELPYSIKMSQLRDSYQSKNGDVSLPSNEEMLDDHHNSNVEFILKHRKSSKKQNLDDTGKSMKKPKRSPFNIFRRGKDDKNNNSSPVGKLFGRPLEDVTEEGLPKAVMDLFRIMYRDGPYTKGILRKSANSVKCKEIHDKLDEGEDCLDDNIQTLVVGAVLKDYLRSLPHCLLLEENYNEWVALSEQDDSSAKMNKVKQLLYKIPPRNFDLLRHLMCVLHHIQEKHTENMMTSYNLAVCITPSILWSKEQIKDPMATQSPHKAIMYLIDNCAPIFGPETLNLFSDLNEQKNRQDSSTDSDSMHSYLSAQDSGSGMRPDNSSIDSLERDLYSEFDSSPNLMKSHLSPSNLSRDSGLTLSDAQLYDSNENLAERKNYSRSVSQYMDRDSDKSKYIDNVSRSYDNSFDIQNPKPPPRKNKKREFSNEQENVTKSVRNTMTPSYSAEGFLDYKGNSTESLRSLEDTCAESDVHHEFLRHPDFGTLIKSSSGAHLYYDETKQETTKNQRFVSEMEIQTRPPVGGNGRLMRQASVTDSNPPTSPHSRLSCGSSIDSGIPHSSSCSSFMHGQASHESDSHFSIWSTSEDRFHASQDDALLNNQYSSARKSSNSKKTVNYLVSPPISPKTSRKVFNSDLQHKGLSMRRSFPMDDPSHTKGSGSDSYKEAEDIIRPRFQLSTFDSSGKDQDYTSPILSSRYGSSASASDVRTNMPMKAINKYGLGTSPPPGVILKLHQNKQRRDITPMRASHDSSILSQVRRNSTDSSGSDPRQTTTEHHHSELIVGRLNTPPYPLRRSDSDGEINRSLSSSPSRPDRPPSYDEACQRTFMIKHGIPLEISEQDSEKQKEASLRAKQLYEESLRKYMEEHLNSPSVSDRTTVSRKEEVIMEQEEGESDNTESSEEEIEYRKNDPKKIYEESMKVYEQMSKNTSGPIDKTPAIKNAQTNHHLSPNLHRSCSDSSEHLNKVGNWSRRSPTRDKSPLASDRKSVEISRKSSSTQLNYSSSSVSNSSSETVTENQQIPPYRRDRSESSPVTSRHYFPKTSDNFAQNISAQSQQKSSKEFFASRDSSVESKYSVRTRDAPPSQDWRNSYSQEQKKTTTIQDSSKPRFFTGARASSLEGQDRTGNRDTSAKTNINKFESKSSITWKSKAKHESALSWSVKNLRSVYDQSNSDRSSSPSGSQTNELRPPPPPYQPPPPFRRDNARMSSSSNSSCSSSNTDHSANIPQTKNSLSHRRLGGPQARDSFSDDSDTSSRSSGHLKNSSNSSSDHETWTYLDTEVTFV